MSARKIEKFPVQVLSLDAIKVDRDLQSRVSTSMEYQREFSEAMLRGDVFPPVVVFLDGKTYWLADGFHRYGATKQAAKMDRRFEGIRAEIREGSRRDAMVYSAGANIKFSIPRTPEDIKKAVWMLLDDEEWRNKGTKTICDHVGCSPMTLKKNRIAFEADRGIALPEILEDYNGNPYWAKRDTMARIFEVSRGYYAAKIGKKKIHLGNDRVKAEQKLKEIYDKRNKERASLNMHALDRRFATDGLLFQKGEFRTTSYAGIDNIRFGHGIVWVSCQFEKTPSGFPSNRVPEAVGRVLLARQLVGLPCSPVVVCYLDAAPLTMIETARQLGVEFLTPEELVARVKGEAPQPEAQG